MRWSGGRGRWRRGDGVTMLRDVEGASAEESEGEEAEEKTADFEAGGLLRRRKNAVWGSDWIFCEGHGRRQRRAIRLRSLLPKFTGRRRQVTDEREFFASWGRLAHLYRAGHFGFRAAAFWKLNEESGDES